MNKIVLITGATSGIGKACAIKFAAAKYDLIITGRRNERLNELKKNLKMNMAFMFYHYALMYRIKKQYTCRI